MLYVQPGVSLVGGGGGGGGLGRVTECIGPRGLGGRNEGELPDIRRCF